MTEILQLQKDDDWTTIRGGLRQTLDPRAVIVLPWDVRFFSRQLNGELVRREAERLGLEVAVVCEDPDRRAEVRAAGLPAYGSVAQAEAAPVWRHPEQAPLEPPHPAWWEEPLTLFKSRKPGSRSMRHVRYGVNALVFLFTILFLLTSAYVIIPRATITLVPNAQKVEIVVPVSFSTDVEAVDTEAGVIPARRVGDYFEGYLEVETTGSAAYQSGRATGNVLFTNLLGQPVTAPTGTIVRTSSTGFPVRFRTTQEVVVPTLGQAPAPVEALDEGPVGNVVAYQINQVEGVAALALRVTNTDPIYGGASQEVRAVSQADMDRALTLLTAQLLDQAYEGLLGYLEPTEFMPHQSLEIQSSEASYNRFLTERADVLGLQLRLLITGLAMDRDNAEAVAYAALSRNLPSGFGLIEADFEIGELAEEPTERGNLTFFVTAVGYTAADIDFQAVERSILGQPASRAVERLAESLPLAEPADVQVWPDWPGRVPVLPLRITVDVIPGAVRGTN
jgi:hypothetical protein